MSSRDQVPGTSNVADERGWRAIQRELQDIRRRLDRLEASFGLKRKIEMADVIIAALPPDSVDATHGSPRPGGSSMHDLRAQLDGLQRDLASVRAAVQRALDAWQRLPNISIVEAILARADVFRIYWELRGMIEEVEKVS